MRLVTYSNGSMRFHPAPPKWEDGMLGYQYHRRERTNTYWLRIDGKFKRVKPGPAGAEHRLAAASLEDRLPLALAQGSL